MKVRERIEMLVDKLCRDVTSTLIVRYGQRLRPETLQHFRELFEDALGHARRIGELHANQRPESDEDVVASLVDTQPGFKSRPPPKK